MTRVCRGAYIGVCADRRCGLRAIALSGRTVERRGPDEGWPGVRTIVRGAALALVALHVLLLSAPDAVLGWNPRPAALILSAGFPVGAVCSWPSADDLARPAPGRRHATAIGDVVVSTLVGIELVSGLMLALFYRWASSWSVVTLTPYAVSLLRFNPRVELVTSMPFLVRLHVFCAFAILVALPFATGGSTAVVAVRRAAATAAAPVTRTSRLLARRGRVDQGCAAALSGNDEGARQIVATVLAAALIAGGAATGLTPRSRTSASIGVMRQSSRLPSRTRDTRATRNSVSVLPLRRENEPTRRHRRSTSA